MQAFQFARRIGKGEAVRETAGAPGGRQYAPGARASQGAASVQHRALAPAAGAVPVGPREDPSEHEARRVADAVAAGRQVPRVTHDRAEVGRRTGGDGAAGSVGMSGLGAGTPMAPAHRTFFEERLGTDLGHVRVHHGARAAAATRAANATAVTVGSDIVLGQHAPSPSTPEGVRLFAHELVHVAQQTGAGPYMADRSGVARRADYCLPAGECWNEDPITGVSTALDHTPADAIMVEAPNGPLDVSSFAVDPVADILLRLAALDLRAMEQQGQYDPTTGLLAPGGERSPVVWLGGAEPGSAWSHTRDESSRWMPWLGSQLAAYQSPYYYRFLAPYDPNVAQIRGGADLFPVPLDPGRTFRPAASRAEMTFRHLRPGGNVNLIGTDRISTGRNLDVLIDLAQKRGTGEIVRIDPSGARSAGAHFLEFDQILRDLDAYEAQIREDLRRARDAGRGKNAIRRIENRLHALQQARRYARGFQEGQGIGHIPSSAVSGVRYPRLEKWGPRGVRAAGWALLALDGWLRYERVMDAPPEDRGYETRKQTAGFVAGAANPILGMYAEYAVETAEKGPRPLTMAFPTVYTWMLDAVIGEELEAQDPEGAQLIRKMSSGDPAATQQFFQGLAGLPY